MTKNNLNDGLVFYGLAFTQLGALGVLFFWIIGTVLDVNFGNIIYARAIEPFRFLYYAYPFVVAVCLVAAWALFWFRFYRAALALSGLPLAAAVLYYLVLVQYWAPGV